MLPSEYPFWYLYERCWSEKSSTATKVCSRKLGQSQDAWKFCPRSFKRKRKQKERALNAVLNRSWKDPEIKTLELVK